MYWKSSTYWLPHLPMASPTLISSPFFTQNLNSGDELMPPAKPEMGAWKMRTTVEPMLNAATWKGKVQKRTTNVNAKKSHFLFWSGMRYDVTSSPFLSISPVPSASYTRSSGGSEDSSFSFGLFVLNSGSIYSCRKQMFTLWADKRVTWERKCWVSIMDIILETLRKCVNRTAF